MNQEPPPPLAPPNVPPPVEGPLILSALHQPIDPHAPAAVPAVEHKGPRLRNQSDDEPDRDAPALRVSRNIRIQLAGYTIIHRQEYRVGDRHEEPRFIARPCPIHGLPCQNSRAESVDYAQWGDHGARMYMGAWLSAGAALSLEEHASWVPSEADIAAFGNDNDLL